jgi:hypothetical protein
MSAIGTKRTSLFAPHMSAIGGKADIEIVLRRGRMAPPQRGAPRIFSSLCDGVELGAV